MRVCVDRERCRGCRLCVKACPARALWVEAGRAAVSDACTRCGGCIPACPFGALRAEQDNQPSTEEEGSP